VIFPPEAPRREEGSAPETVDPLQDGSQRKAELQIGVVIREEICIFDNVGITIHVLALKESSKDLPIRGRSRSAFEFELNVRNREVDDRKISPNSRLRIEPCVQKTAEDPLTSRHRIGTEHLRFCHERDDVGVIQKVLAKLDRKPPCPLLPRQAWGRFPPPQGLEKAIGHECDDLFARRNVPVERSRTRSEHLCQAPDGEPIRSFGLDNGEGLFDDSLDRDAIFPIPMPERALTTFEPPRRRARSL
jgi:hypothetical protein